MGKLGRRIGEGAHRRRNNWVPKTKMIKGVPRHQGKRLCRGVACTLDGAGMGGVMGRGWLIQQNTQLSRRTAGERASDLP